jgi:hypothetical protein
MEGLDIDRAFTMKKPARELDRAFKSVNKIHEQRYKRKLKQFSRGS